MKLNPTHYIKLLVLLLIILLSSNSSFAKKKKHKPTIKPKTSFTSNPKRDSIFRKPIPFDIESSANKTDIDGIIWFAKQQLGTPYKYASANPKDGGLDCSGFLYYVFTHFNIKVPRSSRDYMDYGKTIDKKEAQQGDVGVQR